MKEMCSSALSSFLLIGIQKRCMVLEQPCLARRWKHMLKGQSSQKLPEKSVNLAPLDQHWAAFYMKRSNFSLFKPVSFSIC